MKFPAETFARLRPFYEGAPVVVTGGAGFIGGHLVDALLSLGATIAVIDDLSNSTHEHLSELMDLEPERLQFVRGSILDDEALSQAMTLSGGGAKAGPPGGRKAPAAVFHLAAIGSVPRSLAEPQRTWSVNSTGTVRVLEAARAAGARRVVFSASSSAYGDEGGLTPGPAKLETQAPRALSPYAASKIAGEVAMTAWARSYGLSTVSLRYFNVFGPRQPADSAYAAVVPVFSRALLAGEAPVIFGDGQQTRDFTSVANAVLATLLAGASDKALAGEVLNVGTGRRVSLIELAGMMAAIIGKEGGERPPLPVFQPARAGDVRHSLADLTRIKDLLGYAPIATLEQGLEETIAWCRHGAAAR